MIACDSVPGNVRSLAFTAQNQRLPVYEQNYEIKTKYTDTMQSITYQTRSMNFLTKG